MKAFTLSFLLAACLAALFYCQGAEAEAAAGAAAAIDAGEPVAAVKRSAEAESPAEMPRVRRSKKKKSSSSSD